MDPLEQKRNGYSLADCAEIMTRMSALKTELGEPGYQAPFQQFLRSKGLTENTWAQVWNDWHQVTENDPALGAKFHTYMGQVRQRQMMANQPNVGGESMEGLSLESYAKISAQSQTGAAVEGLVAAEGLTMDQWLGAQAAWGQRMGNCSPTDPVMIQFGQLYQKWSPNHQASMEAATARHLEDAAASQGRGGGMSKELTMDNAAEFFDNADVRVRARGVREAIRIWELSWDARDERMHHWTQRAYDEAIRILSQGAGDDRPGMMALNAAPDTMDIHTWSKLADDEEAQQGTSDLVYGALKDLASEKFMSPQQNEAAIHAVRQAIARLEPRAQRVNQIFPQATDELKKVQLRSLVDDYRETLSDMQEALGDWDYSGPEAAAAVAAAAVVPGHAVSVPSVAVRPPSTGILGVLKSLPLIGTLLRLLGM
ncbi:MAG: hypothetical protein ACRBN8_42490 [Nannocystales bacterium]